MKFDDALQEDLQITRPKIQVKKIKVNKRRTKKVNRVKKRKNKLTQKRKILPARYSLNKGRIRKAPNTGTATKFKQN